MFHSNILSCSRKKNIFMYTCCPTETTSTSLLPDRLRTSSAASSSSKNEKHVVDVRKKVNSRLFAYIMSRFSLTNSTHVNFTYNDSRFVVSKSKRSTARVVVWQMGVPNSCTIEASFCGNGDNKRENRIKKSVVRELQGKEQQAAKAENSINGPHTIYDSDALKEMGPIICNAILLYYEEGSGDCFRSKAEQQLGEILLADKKKAALRAEKRLLRQSKKAGKTPSLQGVEEASSDVDILSSVDSAESGSGKEDSGSDSDPSGDNLSKKELEKFQTFVSMSLKIEKKPKKKTSKKSRKSGSRASGKTSSKATAKAPSKEKPTYQLQLKRCMERSKNHREKVQRIKRKASLKKDGASHSQQTSSAPPSNTQTVKRPSNVGGWKETQKLNLFDRGVANDQMRLRERKFWLVRKGQRFSSMMQKKSGASAPDHNMKEQAKSYVRHPVNESRRQNFQEFAKQRHSLTSAPANLVDPEPRRKDELKSVEDNMQLMQLSDNRGVHDDTQKNLDHHRKLSGSVSRRFNTEKDPGFTGNVWKNRGLVVVEKTHGKRHSYARKAASNRNLNKGATPVSTPFETVKAHASESDAITNRSELGKMLHSSIQKGDSVLRSRSVSPAIQNISSVSGSYSQRMMRVKHRDGIRSMKRAESFDSIADSFEHLAAPAVSNLVLMASKEDQRIREVRPIRRRSRLLVDCVGVEGNVGTSQSGRRIGLKTDKGETKPPNSPIRKARSSRGMKQEAKATERLSDDRKDSKLSDQIIVHTLRATGKADGRGSPFSRVHTVSRSMLKR